MNAKKFYTQFVGASGLILLLLVPGASNASDVRYSSIGFQVYSGYNVPSVRLFGFGISNPYTSRRHRNHSYGGAYSHYGWGGNRHGYQHGYKQGHRNNHSVNKQWLRRKSQGHHDSRRSGHNGRQRGYNSSPRGGHNGYRH